MLAAVLFIGGLGSAAFHPPAAALVHAVSVDRKGLAMATHISAGSLGFAVAPLCFAPAISSLGPTWAWLVALPGLLALAYTLRLIRRVQIPKKHEAQHWRRCVRTPGRSGCSTSSSSCDAHREQPRGFSSRCC